MQCPGGNRRSHRNSNSHHQPQITKPRKMDHEAETKTIRLSEITKCIAKALLASAEEMERSLWHSTPTEHSQSSSDCDDDALNL
jgi:hypothetical protein